MVEIHVDASDLVRLAKRFHGFKALAQRAIREGLNQGGDKVATDVRKALWKQTGVKAYGTILRHTRTAKAWEGQTWAGEATYAYVIVANGKGLPLKLFKANVKSGPGGGVIGYPWAVGRQFQRSFSEDGTVGGARARTGDKRFPIRKLYGASVAKEALKGATPTVFLLSSQAQIPPIILARLSKALGSSA